jgi:ubiquinone/menaquinone biosynthesis C-methylase UbiE
VTSAEYIREQQYASETNLAARQSIYQYRTQPFRLHPAVIDLASLTGAERMLDVGCGNGAYLYELARRKHSGMVCGFDMSRGMLDGPRRNGLGPLGVADAQYLPFVDNAFDCVLSMHMLYHVPDRALGIREFRRVLRPGGVLLVVTNATTHMQEIDNLIVDAGGKSSLRNMLKFKMENGGDELREQFDDVTRHDFVGELAVTEAQPIVDYIASMQRFVTGEDAALLPVIEERLATIMKNAGEFRITTAAGCFVCR